MLIEVMTSPLQLAWLGAILLLCGEVVALFCVGNLVRLIVVSTLADFGYVLIGLGLGGPAGDAGAAMHLEYQVAMRGFLGFAAWWLIRRSGSALLCDLTGSGRRMPVAATLFGFGMFSVMGLSPFKGAFSRFLVLYAAIEQGQWLIAAVGTVASIVAAVYFVVVIQRVCFEPPRRRLDLAPPPVGVPTLAVGLGLLTIVMSLWPAPFLDWAKAAARVADGAAVPEFESPWASIALLPYVGGFAVYAVGRVSARARDVAAVALAAGTLALAWFDPGLEPASRVFVLLIAAIAFVVVLYSLGYMAHADYANRYWFFLFLMIGSLVGVASASDFGNFYVFWELMTWTSYFLVIHEQTERALKAGLVYFVMCAAGAYVMHFGILLVHAETGTFEMAAVAAHAGRIAPGVGALALACFLVGFAVKAGLVPLHQWLPLAHPAAPSSISAPLSGILTKAGVFGLVKVFYVVFGAAALDRFAVHGVDFGAVVTVLGCATLLYGEAMALTQQELKRMLAYSTLAQIGEIAAVLGLGTSLAATAALLHATNHAAMKSLLFLAAGALILRGGRRRIDELAGLGRAMPVTAGCYALATLAIMGLPPFSGFVSKFLMIYAAAEAGQVAVAAVILAGSFVGCFYYLRVVRLLFFHPYEGPAIAEAPASMLAAMAVLAAAVVAGGFAPQFQLGLIAPAVAEMTARGLRAVAVPNLGLVWTPAAAIAAAGAVAAYLVGRRSVAWAGRVAVASLLLAALAVAVDGAGRDHLSFWFGILIALVGAGNMSHATGYLAHGHAQPRFYAAFGLMIAGLLGLAASPDAFNFFAFWELMSSWTLYFAIIHEETDDARREGFKYFLFNTVGASLMFLGFAMLSARAGSFDFAELGRVLRTASPAWGGGAVVLVFLGLVMKAAQVPVRIDYQMHPATAPTPVSGYISAVLLKCGPFGLLKLSVLLGGAAAIGRLGMLDGMPVVMYAVAAIAAVTILYAGAMAVIQNGIKRLLIYSTVSQLGYILLGVSLGTDLGVAGGLMHLANHMMLKNLLFLGAGCIMAQVHATSLDQLGGLARRMPATFGIFLFAGLSLAGLPPLNGFASKWLIFQAAFQSGHYVLGTAAMVGSLLTLAAILKFVHAAFLGTPCAAAAEVREAPLAMLAPMAAMTAACVVVGIFPGVLLVPIAAIEGELGLAPVAASLFGGLPGIDGWSPIVLWALAAVVAAIVGVYPRLGGRGAPAVGTHLHACGVTDIAPTATHVAASNLFESADRAIRLALQPRRGG